MTTQELHIELDRLLQKVSTNWNSNFLPQEIDAFINREIITYLKQRIFRESNIKQVGIYDVLKRVFDTNDCLVDTVVPLYNLQNQGEVESLLPLDFFYYIESNVSLNCDSKATLTNIKQYKLSFNDILGYDTPIKDFTSFKVNLKVLNESNGVIGTHTLFNLTSLPSNYFPSDNRPDNVKAFIYNNAILMNSIRVLQNLTQYNIQIIYNKITDKFDIYSNVPISIDVVMSTESLSWTEFFIYTFTNHTQYTFQESATRSVDIIDEEFKTKIKNSSLSGSTTNVLKGSIRKDKLKIIKPKGYHLSVLNLNYIRKPLKVDVLLGYNSDLKDEVLLEVIHNVARTLKGVISSDTYEKFIQENLIVE